MPTDWNDIQLFIESIEKQSGKVQEGVRRFLNQLAPELIQYREAIDASTALQSWIRHIVDSTADHQPQLKDRVF